MPPEVQQQQEEAAAAEIKDQQHQLSVPAACEGTATMGPEEATTFLWLAKSESTLALAFLCLCHMTDQHLCAESISLEQMMVNEAIRLSLASAEEDARRSSNAEQEQRNQQASGTSAATHSDTVTAAASDPATGDAQYVSAQTDSLPVPTTLSQADPLVAESLQPADVGQEAAAPPATDANQNNTSGYQNLRDSEADDASVKGSPVIQHDEARQAAAR